MSFCCDAMGRVRWAGFWLMLMVGLGSSLAGAQVPAAKAMTAPSAEAAAVANPAQAAKGAEPGQPTAPRPATAVALAALPKPLPPELTKDINVETRSKLILAHLSEVIRYYRMALAPVQKIGEPSDMLYAEQAQAEATKAAQLAFQSARDEAALLARIEGQPGAANPAAPQAEAQRLNSTERTIALQIIALEAQNDALDQQIARAPAKLRGALEEQQGDVQGQLELAKASSEALSKVIGLSSAQSNSGLQADIDRLQSSAPELVNSQVKPVASTIESLGSLRDAGVSTQAITLFQLIGASSAVGKLISETQTLHDQAVDLRTPLIKILRATLAAGRAMQPAAPGDTAAAAGTVVVPPVSSPSVSSELAARKKTYDQLSNAFKTVSDVSIPISQEVLLLEQARGNLLSWRAAVDTERSEVMRLLVVRVICIGLALGLILAISNIWRRATTRYVQDVRRRRQLLLIRRLVIGFLSGLVLIFGFVTQFSSLATFAGFITAGIAVGLQTILLSVAAYFFIVGRFGVRVGDRITVAGVTGDVVDVGLVRFYMMELTGTGNELHPTGRIAVFANSILFQTGTPIYKQIPGTDYAWHELTLKLKPGTDYMAAAEAVRGAIETVYDGYKAVIEQQHQQVEAWMDNALAAPHLEARLQLADGLQYAVLYPVQISRASETDQEIVEKVLAVITQDAAIMAAIDGAPTVRAVIKG